MKSMPLSELLKAEFEERVINESIVRIKKCLEMIDEEYLWKSPNDNIMTIGSSVLHVVGNSRQWILSGIFKEDDFRQRDWEFEQHSISIKELVVKLDKLKNDLLKSLEELSESHLTTNMEIQGFKVTGLSSIVHVIEHFSYHTGQITLLTKLYSGESTDYYDEFDLNIRN